MTRLTMLKHLPSSPRFSRPHALALAALLSLGAASCGEDSSEPPAPPDEGQARGAGLVVRGTFGSYTEIAAIRFVIYQRQNHCSPHGTHGPPSEQGPPLLGAPAWEAASDWQPFAEMAAWDGRADHGYDSDDGQWEDCRFDRPVVVDVALDLELGLDGYERPWDPGESAHRAADSYVVLPSGIYAVLAMPLDRHGRLSKWCRPAWNKDVAVVDAETTEVELFSQCSGPDRGGLDTLLHLNHAPRLHVYAANGTLSEQTCHPVVVCAVSTELDGDPVAFAWSANPPALRAPKPTNLPMQDHERLLEQAPFRGMGTHARQCMALYPDGLLPTRWEITAWDLLPDGTRIEEYLINAHLRDPARTSPSPSHARETWTLAANPACQGPLSLEPLDPPRLPATPWHGEDR